MRIKLILLLVLYFICSLNAQSEYIASLDLVVVGPQNVNLHYEEQRTYYLKKYLPYLKDARNYLAQLTKEKEVLLEKKKLKKRDKIKIGELESLEAVLISEIRILNNYVERWRNYKLLDTPPLTKAIHDFDCLEIVTDERIYSPNEYTIVRISNQDSIFWNEIGPTIQTEQKVSNAMWVKKPAGRDCLSADPADCMVWVLVEVPENGLSSTCPTSYYRMKGKDFCTKQFTVANEFKDSSRTKIYSIMDYIELKIVETRKVKCN